MAVRAGAEPDEVEGADVHGLQPVLRGALVAAELALHTVDVRRPAFEPVEQRRLRHRVVRALVVGRHAALVSPPELDVAPVGLEPGRDLVRAAWGGAADRKSTRL